MNRAEKFHKLTNAIKLLRGKTNGVGGKWIQKPVPKAIEAVTRWLSRINLSSHGQENALKFILKCRAYDDLHAFLIALEENDGTKLLTMLKETLKDSNEELIKMDADALCAWLNNAPERDRSAGKE